MKNIFKIGVLGLGEGRSIISAVQNSKYWELGCICDLNEQLCRRRCVEFGINRYTTSYEEMLEDDSIDVIGIYTPDQLHALHICMALEKGKNVICTKPLMTSLDEANHLIEVQKKTQKTVFVGQSSRYFEPMRRQREDYLEGKHGELLSVETHYISDSRWFLERAWSHQKGFSWMYNFMIHAVDLALWYLPDIQEVYGVGIVSPNTECYGVHVPDMLHFVLKGKDGKYASVSGSYATPTLGSEVEQSISCTLRGSEGISRAGYPKLKYYTNFNPMGEKTSLQEFHELHDYYFRFEGETHHAGEYQNYIEDFALHMLENRTPMPNLKEGIHTLAVMEAMNRAMKTSQIVSVEDILKERNISFAH